MASDWLLSLLLGTAVYGSVRTVVWKDGMESNPMPPIRLYYLIIRSEQILKAYVNVVILRVSIAFFAFKISIST